MEDQSRRRTELLRPVVIPLRVQVFKAGSIIFVCGGSRIRVGGIVNLTSPETAQMKTGGTRPTAPEEFLLAIKRIVKRDIFACGHRRSRNHNTKL
jgi:hypothetical protein